MALVPMLDLRAAKAEPAHAPSNMDAEAAVLGALLYDNSAFERLGEFLQPRHFFEPFHQRLFAAIDAGLRKGQLVEPVLLADQFEGDEGFEQLGRMRYLADLVDRAPPAANAHAYAKVVFDAAIRRDVLAVCHEGALAAGEYGDGSAFDVVSGIRQQLEAVENAAAPEDGSMVAAPVAAAQAIVAMRDMAAQGRPRGKLTGLRCFDRRLNGLKPGSLVVIGGRPGMCKTGLARQCAHGAAVRNPDDTFLFLGIEMGPEEMMQRELSALSHEFGTTAVEYRSMGSGALTALDLMSIDEASAHVPANLILDDCTTLSVDDVRRKVWSLNRRTRVAAVFIDYLQLMRRPAANGRNEASVLAEMTQGLKQIARQAKITVVLLSQLNRAVEARDDKRPQLSDLRESGSIEQDADAVLFPFREFYYVHKAEPKESDVTKHLEWEVRCEDLRRRLDVICSKQRQGPDGMDRQRYLAEFDFIEDDRDAR
jgi:replicative DNA helicase